MPVLGVRNHSSTSFKPSNAAPQNVFIFAAVFASASLLCWATTWHLAEPFGRKPAATLGLPSSQVMRIDLLGVALRMVRFAANHFLRVFSSVHAWNALAMGASIV